MFIENKKNFFIHSDIVDNRIKDNQKVNNNNNNKLE